MSPETTTAGEPDRPILIVDDEEIVLVALRDTLLREGYNVVASPHAIHALSVLKQQQFSVVITDQQMPMVSGLEFLAQVREIQPDATRILITAVLSLSTVIDAINKGEIYRFIVKPWLREELLATVKNAVQRHDLISKNARLQAETQAMNAQLTDLNRALEAQVARVAEQNKQLQRIRPRPGGKSPPLRRVSACRPCAPFIPRSATRPAAWPAFAPLWPAARRIDSRTETDPRNQFLHLRHRPHRRAAAAHPEVAGSPGVLEPRGMDLDSSAPIPGPGTGRIRPSFHGRRSHHSRPSRTL